MRLLLSVNLGLRNLSEIYFYLLMKHVYRSNAPGSTLNTLSLALIVATGVHFSNSKWLAPQIRLIFSVRSRLSSSVPSVIDWLTITYENYTTSVS